MSMACEHRGTVGTEAQLHISMAYEHRRTMGTESFSPQDPKYQGGFWNHSGE